jgi:hypothetical protein
MELDAIKGAIAELPAAERTALAAWLAEQEMDEWDKQMQKDFSPGGRGMHVVEKIRADIGAGKFKPLDHGQSAEH